MGKVKAFFSKLKADFVFSEKVLEVTNRFYSRNETEYVCQIGISNKPVQETKENITNITITNLEKEDFVNISKLAEENGFKVIEVIPLQYVIYTMDLRDKKEDTIKVQNAKFRKQMIDNYKTNIDTRIANELLVKKTLSEFIYPTILKIMESNEKLDDYGILINTEDMTYSTLGKFECEKIPGEYIKAFANFLNDIYLKYNDSAFGFDAESVLHGNVFFHCILVYSNSREDYIKIIKQKKERIEKKIKMGV